MIYAVYGTYSMNTKIVQPTVKSEYLNFLLKGGDVTVLY